MLIQGAKFRWRTSFAASEAVGRRRVYYSRPANIPWKQGTPKVGTFEDAIARGRITGYIVGGAPAELINTVGRPRRDDQDDAIYQAISPICLGLDCSQLPDRMLVTAP
jgi:hypothetical protein